MQKTVIYKSLKILISSSFWQNLLKIYFDYHNIICLPFLLFGQIMQDEHQTHKKIKRFFRQPSMQEQQASQSILIQWLTQYMIRKQKKHLLQALNYVNLQSSNESIQLPYFQKLYLEMEKIITEKNPVSSIQNIYINNDQKVRLDLLITFFENKIINHFIELMKKNPMLRNIKVSKLELIAKTYQIVKLYKRQQINCRVDNLNNIDLFYLLDGQLEKVRYFSLNESNKDKTQKRAANNVYVSLNSVKLKKKPEFQKRNTLRTLILPGQFIADEFFCQYFQDKNRPLKTKFCVLNQSVLIKFQGTMIRKIFAQFYYLEDSHQFYQQKFCIELKKIKSMRQFDQKYQFKSKKRQQKLIKRQLSQEMIQVKKEILKRYKTDTKQSKIDAKSLKQISKMLSKRKNEMITSKNYSFDLPLVEVFESHSQKKRSHQNIALSPLVIVKNQKCGESLYKSENILSQKDKSKIYRVGHQQNLSELKKNNLSLNMKKVHEIVKNKKRLLGSFELLEVDRMINKMKMDIIKRK